MSHIRICFSEWTFKLHRGISHTALIRKRKEQQKHLDLFNLNFLAKPLSQSHGQAQERLLHNSKEVLNLSYPVIYSQL